MILVVTDCSLPPLTKECVLFQAAKAFCWNCWYFNLSEPM